MKFKRIISTALTVVMLFTTLAAVLPVYSGAAHSPSSVVSGSTMSLEDITKYINEKYLKYNYNSAEEMLEAELSAGYLDYSTTANGLYSMYVNRYTGFFYYRNNYTGQILTSNPINPGYNDNKEADEIMGQISIKLVDSSNTTNSYSYNSIEWAALYGQISVSPIAGGLRVNYTLGDTASRFLLPGVITAEKFETNILGVIITEYQDTISMLLPDLKEPMVFLGVESSYAYGHIDNVALRSFVQNANVAVAKEYGESSDTYKAFYQFSNELTQVSEAYTIQNPAEFKGEAMYEGMLNQIYEKFPITKEKDIAVYECKYGTTAQAAKKRSISNIIKKYCLDYTINQMYEDEAECGYIHEMEQKPVLRCVLEYTFNDDGSLSVRLPASSISFDETAYTLETITPLQYFGYGDMSTDGFIFFPDGSGTIVEFEDFYNKNVNLSLWGDVFGQDYCYSKITGAHREQITMPVYGLVTELNTNKTTSNALAYYDTSLSTIKNGFFAIIEEGASLARLNFKSSGSSHKFAGVYVSYAPYPQDTFDLSETLSVGGLGEYIMVSESKYTGSYITRYMMLTDEKMGDPLFGAGNYYASTYSGMADYYRNYLKADGTLSALEVVSSDLPLYIEALGSMTITSKFLTFPVEESIALTSFSDILVMYKELSNSKKHINSLIEELRAQLADEDTTDEEKVLIEKDIAYYEDLLTKVQNIRNINFKLTGFANDGMYYTYPSKVKWEKACGGESGFEYLVSESQRISKTDGVNFGIYPEFDFMYISNTTMFDGISERESVSRMVDNRYASKQIYNSILQSYESFFTMVVSSDALDGLYTEFIEDYGQYNISSLSVSTLGSDINSNFDDDNPINRDQAREDVIALLDRMANTDGYDLMVDKGNIYAVKYANHILNIATDSSHFTYSSFAIPFVGMILHGYVNYAGTPINYTGSPDYEILRSIENGAAPYFILCYENTEHMKDDEQLNKYYGVNYTNWYDDVLLTYAELNSQIGSLQDYEIIKHNTLIAERTLSDDEKAKMYSNLEAEYIARLEAAIVSKLDAKFDVLRENGKYDARVKIVFDAEAITAQFRSVLVPIALDFDADSFGAKLEGLIAKYTAEYPGAADESKNEIVDISIIDNYRTAYKYSTESEALDEDYEYTEYTLDTGKVVMVTYKHKNGDVVRFVLNYNIYSVDVTIDGQQFTLGKYEYKKLEG